jgi:hypothetical protein
MLYKVARPDCILLEPCIDNPDVYVDPALPDVNTEPPPPGIIVFHVEEAIIFPNAHYIRCQLLKAVYQACASGKPSVAPEDEMWCNAKAAAAARKRALTNNQCNCTSHHHEESGSSSSSRFHALGRFFQSRRDHQHHQHCSHENNSTEVRPQSTRRHTPGEIINPDYYSQYRNSLNSISAELNNINLHKLNDDLKRDTNVKSNRPD